VRYPDGEMRAAWYERQGAAAEVLVVGEMDDPLPGPGEVRVRVHASGINPSDTYARAGSTAPMPFPRVVPDQDGAGVIDRVGPDVPAGRVGERVWVYEATWQRPFGTAAEYTTVPAVRAVPLPDTTDFEAGACLGVPALTAHRCVFADGPVEGRTVLVTGGAGAVGSAAVQLARWGGARVIATVSSDAKAEVARTAGADHVVNYRTQDVAAAIEELTGGAGVDRVVEVDFGGNLATSQRVLKANGVLAAYASRGAPEPVVPFRALMRKNLTLRLVLVYDMPEAAKTDGAADVTRALEEGLLRPVVGATYPLERIADAHVAVERGAVIGNVVVQVG
jgi:NADPH:quinone reductase